MKIFFILVVYVYCAMATFSVTKNKLFYNEQEYRIKGINWFGIETICNVPHGLWIHNTEFYMDTIRNLAFNSIRVPFSYEVAINLDAPLLSLCTLSDFYIQDFTARQYIHHLFYHAKIRGMTILLDFHTDHGLIQPSPTSEITKIQWFNAWKNMLLEYGRYENLIGIDIKNEPHGDIRWPEWAKDVNDFLHFLEKNPSGFNGLIWVQGIEDPFDGSPWGGSFSNLNTYLGVNPSLKIVFSPHVYGVSVRGDFAVYDGFDQWNRWFGYLQKYYDNLICIGEMGGWNAGNDNVWHQNLLQYLQATNITNFYYWALNPDSKDTGGLLSQDWTTIDQSKVDFCYNLQKNPTFIQF